MLVGGVMQGGGEEWEGKLQGIRRLIGRHKTNRGTFRIV